MICHLCDDYHDTRTWRYAQNVDYYDEFEPFNHCFDQYDPNWDNSYVYSWNNQYGYNAPLYFYNYQFEFVQLESKPFWKLAIERLVNALLSWKLAIERLANTTSDHFDRVENILDELASQFGRI